MAYRKTNNGGGHDGPTAEERALDKFADLMIEKIKGMQQGLAEALVYRGQHEVAQEPQRA